MYCELSQNSSEVVADRLGERPSSSLFSIMRRIIKYLVLPVLYV